MIHNLRITPLGGVGEVGANNCMLYETDTEAVIVDCGTMFPDQETLGVDMIIPDFAYLREIKHKLKAVVFTHGHEDHIGAVPFLSREFCLPIYATPFTLGLIKEKLEEYNLPKTPKLNLFTPGDAFTIGSFEFDTVYVNHSIIDAAALVIQTSHGPIVHVTDWKIDPTPPNGQMTDLKKFAHYGKKDPILLFSDSTNAGQPGATLSEKEVMSKLKKICADHDGRIIVTLFASNIHRVQSLAKIAGSIGRRIALVGRSMKENTNLARQIGKLSFEGVEIIDVEETNNYPPDEVMILATGTQGEPRSVLSRMASNAFKPFKIQDGDLVLFSSKMIPGNEKNVYGVINNLSRHGARVVYESVYDIHTSGHAHQEELKTLIKKVKPKYFVPIHGEYRHLLKHRDLAIKCGIKPSNVFVIENGTTLTVEDGNVYPLGEVPTGRVFVDGRGVGDVGEVALRDRRHLADTGIVICVLMIDRKSGEILHGPELISRGFIEEKNSAILDRAKEGVLECLKNINWETRTDSVEVKEEVRVNLRRFFNKELDRKPVVIPVIQEV